jgi:eukaryotic-like serine/threonine-protein kinase
VQKALEKERDRRYASAAALGEDLRRHQADEPILARPPSGLYHARKLVSRHRLAASMLVTVFVLSLGTAVWTGVLYRREADLRVEADQARARADREAELARVRALTAEKTKTFLVGVFDAGNLDLADTTDLRASELLVRGIDLLGNELADEPVVRAELLRELGQTLSMLGRFDRAEPALEEALLLRRAQTPPDRVALADALSALGTLRQRQRRSAESIRLHEECLAIARETEGEDGVSVTIALSNIAVSVKDQGDLLRAEALYRDVLARRRARFGEDDPGVIKTRNDLAMTLSQQRRTREAKELMEVVLEDTRRVMPRSLRLCSALNGLAIQCTTLEQYDRAEALHLESIALRTELVGEEDQAVGFSWSNLGQTYENSGRFQNAYDCNERARQILVAIHGEENANVAIVLDNLSKALAGLGRMQEAEELAQRALDARLRLLDPSHPDISESRQTLGKIRYQRSNFEGAVDELCRAVEGFSRKLGDASERTTTARTNLGAALLGARRLRESEEELLGAFEALATNPDTRRSSVRNTARWLSRLYRAKGETAEAEHYEELERAAAAGP